MSAHTPIPLNLLSEQHLRTAVQALAYLLAFNSVTKQESVFDAEREHALAVIRDNAATIIAACNSHDALIAALDQINVAACYASEEDPGASKEVLLHIGAMARAALSSSKASS